MSAMIIAFAQAKGGVGKSTLCANLATTFSGDEAILIVDCDPPQHSLVHWFTVRQQNYESDNLEVLSVSRPAELLDLIERERSNYDIILLDGPPHLNAMSRAIIGCASILIVPLAPSPVEVWSYEAMDELMKEASAINPKLQAKVCWTRVRTRVKSNEYLIGEVKSASHIKPLSAILTQRVAYLDSFAQGLTVYEWTDAVARAEIWSVSSAIRRLKSKTTNYDARKRKKILDWSRKG